LPETNTLAYYNTAKKLQKKFYGFGPRCQSKTFYSSLVSLENDEVFLLGKPNTAEKSMNQPQRGCSTWVCSGITSNT